MDLNKLLSILPSHWEMLPADTESFDDGRDYDKPMFVRRDGLARIYFNRGEEDTKYMFAISWDAHGDGECCGDFQTAITMCDEYVMRYPMQPTQRREYKQKSIEEAT